MTDNSKKTRAPRNRTLTLSKDEAKRFRARLLKREDIVSKSVCIDNLLDRTVNADLFEVLSSFPAECCDLVFADPPYNMRKEFNGSKFRQKSSENYADWLRSWIPEMKRMLKPNGSIYVCGDWRSSAAIQTVLEEFFVLRNRITWEREKGRGSNRNWKNNSEDIWFATVSDDYVFNVDQVKLKRKVLAPYRDTSGEAKDWNETESGRFRLTYPSNLWTDISVPFWSMPENTDHPTQKPEKLLAKLILASSNRGDVVFDPFLGSGTCSVVACKLGRRFFGVELDEEYCCFCEKRLDLAATDASIQGYTAGVFLERNAQQK